MRLAYFVPEFPGQTHIFFWREIIELEKLGVDVDLFSTRLPDRSIMSHSWTNTAIERTQYLTKLGLMDAIQAIRHLPALLSSEVRQAVRAGGRRELLDMVLSLPLAVKLLRECARRGITHVHAHSCGRTALIAALANRIGPLDYSVALHGPLEDYGTLQEFKWRRAAFATVITEKLKREVTEFMPDDVPERTVIQAMGVDLDKLSRTKPYEAFQDGGTLKIFSCGRLHFVKGHQTIIDAVGLLSDRGLDIEVKIAGEDDQQGDGFHRDLQAQIDRLGVGDSVTLLGAVDEARVKECLLDAHIFVLASKHEPLGVAYMEAMSCELPTIGTDAGGVRELIDSGTDGVLIPPDDANALADAIERIAADPVLAAELGRQGRAKIEARFSSAVGARTIKENVFG